MNSLTEYIFDCLFELKDNSSIPDNGKALASMITKNHVTSQRAMELITSKIVGGTAEVIERGILILHYLVCSLEEQFKAEVLSMRCLELLEEIVQIPYISVKQSALEHISIWLALYLAQGLSIAEESIYFEMESIINSELSTAARTNSIRNVHEIERPLDLFTVSDESSSETGADEDSYGASTSYQTEPHTILRNNSLPPPLQRQNSLVEDIVRNLILEHQIDSPSETTKSITIPNKEMRPLENNSCIICMEDSKKFACIPCGHKILCKGCYTNSKGNISTCPMCRQNVQSFLEIFE